MKETTFPFPKKYWVYLVFCVVLGVLLFINIFVADGLTGEKEFWDFTQQDWLYFAVFLLTEIIIGFFLFFFAVKAGKLSMKRQKKVEQYFDQLKYSGIKPGDCDYIWFDFSGDERAKIVKLGDVQYLYVEGFDYKTESWNAVNTVSIFSSLAEIKKVLFYEFDFFCEENTLLDKHGDEMFREESY